MKALLCWTFAGVAALAGISQVQSAERQDASLGSERDRLIGAWHLVALEVPEADGGVNQITGIKGMLLYTRDGHMSVQLMYPNSASNLSNEYVKSGYEASFGSFDVDEAKHIVTHHVQGSITEGLLGKDLPRAYQFSEGRLIIKSIRPDEHWSVTWEHY